MSPPTPRVVMTIALSFGRYNKVGEGVDDCWFFKKIESVNIVHETIKNHVDIFNQPCTRLIEFSQGPK